MTKTIEQLASELLATANGGSVGTVAYLGIALAQAIAARPTTTEVEAIAHSVGYDLGYDAGYCDGHRDGMLGVAVRSDGGVA